MDNNEVLKQVSDTALESSINLRVDVAPVNRLHKLLQKAGILPRVKSFDMRPICLGSLIRISKLLVDIEFVMPGKDEPNRNGKILQANYDTILKHTGAMIDIVAIAINNNDKPAPDKLKRFIQRNFTTKEMQGVLATVLQQMDLTSFMTSIISIKGLNVLESPTAASAENAES